jgi:hypothetical protein
MNKIQNFLIPADDMQRAVKFYQDHFEWDIKPAPRKTSREYHSIKTHPAHEGGKQTEVYGGLFKRGEDNLANITVVIRVASIEECLKKIKEEGHMVVLPKTPLESEGFYAMIKDSEGNVIGLWEEGSNV